MKLGQLGVWTFAFEGQPTDLVLDAAAELDELGYGALWFGEMPGGREAFTQAGLVLAATRRMVVATGIARVRDRPAATAARAQRTLTEAFPDRFLLGLGGKLATNQHESTAGSRPVAEMRAYLDEMDAVAPKLPRVLAALGPGMLALAAERACGAHPYHVPVEHTARAREALGPEAFLAVEQPVVLARQDAREIARDHLGMYVKLAAHHRNNLRRLGFDDDDLSTVSDRMVDAVLVGHAAGDPMDAIARRVRDHLDAGANHVCLQVIDSEEDHLPVNEWRTLAELRADLAGS